MIAVAPERLDFFIYTPERRAGNKELIFLLLFIFTKTAAYLALTAARTAG